MGVSIVLSGEVIDTDKDGYSDQDELHAGTNSKDVSSLIYEGGWPYNSEKDSLSTVVFGTMPQITQVEYIYLVLKNHKYLPFAQIDLTF